MATKTVKQGTMAKAGVMTQVVAAVTAPVVEEKADKPKTVALRGGAAVTRIVIKEGVKYSTKAEHNQNWWNALVKSCKEPASVEEVIKREQVPSHFIGYCLRRGYLQAA